MDQMHVDFAGSDVHHHHSGMEYPELPELSGFGEESTTSVLDMDHVCVVDAGGCENNNNMGKSWAKDLPSAVCCLVFQFLDFSSVLSRVSVVCRSWRHCTNLPESWHSVFLTGNEKISGRNQAVISTMYQRRVWSQLRSFGLQKTEMAAPYLAHLTLHCPRLNKLVMHNCHTLTDAILNQACCLLVEDWGIDSRRPCSVHAKEDEPATWLRPTEEKDPGGPKRPLKLYFADVERDPEALKQYLLALDSSRSVSYDELQQTFVLPRRSRQFIHNPSWKPAEDQVPERIVDVVLPPEEESKRSTMLGPAPHPTKIFEDPTDMKNALMDSLPSPAPYPFARLAATAAASRAREEQSRDDCNNGSRPATPVSQQSSDSDHDSKEQRAECSCAPSLRGAGQTLYMYRGLAELQHLSLGHCRLVTDTALQFLSRGCPRLKTLCLDLCLQVTCNGVEALAQGCKDIVELSFFGCRSIRDDAMTVVCKAWPQLTKLNIGACAGVSDTGLQYVAKLKELRVLEFSSCWTVSDIGVEAIAMGCPQLQHVGMGHTKGTTDRSLKALARLDHLTTLDLKRCSELTDEGLLTFTEQTRARLRSLDAYYCKFGDRGLVQGSKARAFGLMERLNLTHCSLTDTGLTELAKDAKHLLDIDLSYCFDISNDGMRAVATCCPHLKHINLTMNRAVTAETGHWLSVLPLESLVLSFCDIDDAFLQRLLWRRSSTAAPVSSISQRSEAAEAGTDPEAGQKSRVALCLKRLNLYNCVRVSDAGMRYVGRCAELEILVLSGCVRVTDQGLLSLAGCCNLQRLKADATKHTAKGLETLNKVCTRWGFDGSEHLLRQARKVQNPRLASCSIM